MTKTTEQAEKLLERARKHSDAVAELGRVAEEHRRDAILAASAAGISQGEIARRLGLTPGRVGQIIRNVP